MNTASREVLLEQRAVNLTRTEYAILELLMRRRDLVVTRTSMIDAIWGDRDDVERNTLDAFMKLLRAKIDTDPHRRLIHTIRGVGYTLRPGGE